MVKIGKMNKRNIWFYTSVTMLTVSAALLITGSTLLVLPISNEPYIPLGTFITWFGIIALPSAIYWGNQNLRMPPSAFRYLSLVLKIILFLALLWAPICYLLAGNWSFSFSNKETFQGGQAAMRWFWRFSYGIVVVPIVLWVIHLIMSHFLLKEKVGEQEPIK